MFFSPPKSGGFIDGKGFLMDISVSGFGLSSGSYNTLVFIEIDFLELPGQSEAFAIAWLVFKQVNVVFSRCDPCPCVAVLFFPVVQW